MPSRPDLQQFLDRLTSRSLLTEEEQQAILELPGYAEQVRSNRDFVRLGEQLDHACLIVAGFVGRFGQNSNGARQITALHIPGDMADLHSVVQPEATSALQALSTATILRIPHDAVRRTAARYPAVAEALWRDCMVDASILSQWVVNVGRRDAKARIAHVLCEVALRVGAAPAKGEIMFPFPVTQTQLADVTGLTAVHVNRTLQCLRSEHLADVRHTNARIYDWDGLAAAGDFDAEYLQMHVKPQKRLPFCDGELKPIEGSGAEQVPLSRSIPREVYGVGKDEHAND
jgi:CRP-like cAMP-binding protein